MFLGGGGGGGGGVQGSPQLFVLQVTKAGRGARGLATWLCSWGVRAPQKKLNSCSF